MSHTVSDRDLLYAIAALPHYFLVPFQDYLKVIVLLHSSKVKCNKGLRFTKYDKSTCWRDLPNESHSFLSILSIAINAHHKAASLLQPPPTWCCKSYSCCYSTWWLGSGKVEWTEFRCLIKCSHHVMGNRQYKIRSDDKRRRCAHNNIGREIGLATTAHFL